MWLCSNFGDSNPDRDSPGNRLSPILSGDGSEGESVFATVQELHAGLLAQWWQRYVTRRADGVWGNRVTGFGGDRCVVEWHMGFDKGFRCDVPVYVAQACATAPTFDRWVGLRWTGWFRLGLLLRRSPAQPASEGRGAHVPAQPASEGRDAHVPAQPASEGRDAHVPAQPAS